MLTSIIDDSGKELRAKIEIEDEKVVLHSRSGAFGKPNLRNPDYRMALIAILSRLLSSKLMPVGVYLDSREALKVAEAERVVATASELGDPVDELVAKIGKRVAAFGREPGFLGHGNQNKRILVKVPGASRNEIMTVLRRPTSMTPIVYFNIGWMKHYAGADVDDPTVGGHSWLDDHDHGLECFNFLPTDTGRVEGYRPPGKREKVNIDRLGAKPGDNSIGGILVVWLAREPGSGKTLVVGWYREATVYREARTGQFKLNGMHSEYSVSALKKHATLVPVIARSFQVPSSHASPGQGFGQKPTWYGAPTVDERVLAYVNGWNNARKQAHPAKGGRPPRNTDPELRREVEKAAIAHAWKFYEAKYGNGCVESVEPYGRGWDLEVRSGDVEWLVEVKGLLNAALVCELTPNEYEKMCAPDYRARYVVYVVNNALAEEPKTPVPSVFTWNPDESWRTEDGRVLQCTEKVGAVLTCK